MGEDMFNEWEQLKCTRIHHFKRANGRDFKLAEMMIERDREWVSQPQIIQIACVWNSWPLNVYVCVATLHSLHTMLSQIWKTTGNKGKRRASDSIDANLTEWTAILLCIPLDCTM